MHHDKEAQKPRETSWLTRLSNALLREPHDREQLINLLRDATQRNILNADALAMIEGVLQVSELQVRDIMIPRSQTVYIQEKQSLCELLPTVGTSGHSRFPVMGDNRDEVVGILHAKDLLKYSLPEAPAFNMLDNLRPAAIVPESKPLDVLLQEFRLNRNHMAVVVDEYGGVSGIVTIEDIIEQIIGDIADEFDYAEEDLIKPLSSNEFTVKALTPIDEFNSYFATDFSDEECDTIAGLITQRLGHLPQRGESLTIDNLGFKIVHADNRQVRLLRVTRQQPNVIPECE